MDGFDAFPPEPRRIDVAGRIVEIPKIKARQFPKVVNLSAQLMPLVLANQWVLAVSERYDACRDLIAVITGLDAAWIDDLEADHFIRLLMAVTEVNADFFMQRLGPAIRDAATLVKKITDGAMSLPSSPNEVTV